MSTEVITNRRAASTATIGRPRRAEQANEDPDLIRFYLDEIGTTALLTATHYLKDNRILPAGFDKQSASPDIAVRGEAASDPAFIGGSATTRYEIPTAVSGALVVKAELLYQPVGFRWAHNLAPYKAPEPQRFVSYYEAASGKSAQILAQAEGKL